jgi:protein-disulfide isomerase
LVLLVLAVALVACGSNEPTAAEDVRADGDITERETSVNVEKTERVEEPVSAAAPVEVEAEGVAAQGADAPSAVVVPEEAGAVPEFVPPQPVELATGPEAVAFAMGDPDAPVQIIEFTDYQCPFCQRYALGTMPAMLENLVESGRVFYAIKDLPLDRIHPEARSASVAARCAGEQDAYLPMHDAIFTAQAEWSGRGLGAEAIFTDLAAELDLDVGDFTACLADGRQAENVQANVEEAMSLGLNGTPFFIIDGYPLSGAQPYEAFEAAVGLAENGELGDVITAYARQAYEAMLAQQAPPQPAEPVDVPLENAYAIGDPNAPVTIVEYTDFQCPFCARHTLQTFAQIEENLVETGQVRYVFKDFPLTSIHPQATLAAEAARCAGAQGAAAQGAAAHSAGQEAYVAMHNILVDKQEEWSGQANAAVLFADYAAEIGLDRESVATCLETHEFEADVLADMQEGMEIGVRGTPAFLINGHLVSGAQPFEVFEQVVETLIAETAAPVASN